MADIADRANDRAEFFLEQAQRQRRETAAAIPATGFCLACGAPLPAGRWCNAACRDEWQADQKHREK